MVARPGTLTARSSRARRSPAPAVESNAALRRVSILDALPAHLALLDSLGTVVGVNEPWRRFARANGLEPPAGLGLNYLDVCERAAPGDPEGAGRVAPALREILNGRGRAFSLEYPCHSPAERRWFRVEITRVFDERLGNGALVLHHDITERHLAEAKAGEAERRYRAVFDLHFQFLAILSPEGRVLEINDLALTVGGVRRDQILGYPFWRAIWWTQLPGIQDWWATLLSEAARVETPLHRDGVYNTASGETRDVEITLTAGRDDSGALAYFIVQGVDTTEISRETRARKAAEIEMSRINRALKMLTECSEAVMRASDEGALLHSVCEIAVQTGGYQRATVGYPEDEDARATGPSARALQAGQLVVVEDLLVEPALAPVVPRLLQAGLVSGVFLPLKDSRRTFAVLALYSSAKPPITSDERKLLRELADDLAFGIASLRAHAERRKAEAALLASLGEKEALLKEVHHRVKNNMQVITSLLRLESNRVGHATTRVVLKDMQNRIHSMAALHETLYRSGNFAEVNLADYLRQLIRQLRVSLATGPQKIEFHLELEGITLDLDRAVPCGLIVNELISNALKHAFPAGRSGSIWIGLHRAGADSVRLEVRDDGVGLPPGLDATRATSLGLQMVSDLTRQMRGTCSVGPGASVAFRVTFEEQVSGDQPDRVGATVR